MRDRITKVCLAVRSLAVCESGQDLIEYALVVALVVLACAAGMSSVASRINSVFTLIGTKVGTYTHS